MKQTLCALAWTKSTKAFQWLHAVVVNAFDSTYTPVCHQGTSLQQTRSWCSRYVFYALWLLTLCRWMAALDISVYRDQIRIPPYLEVGWCHADENFHWEAVRRVSGMKRGDWGLSQPGSRDNRTHLVSRGGCFTGFIFSHLATLCVVFVLFVASGYITHSTDWCISHVSG